MIKLYVFQKTESGPVLYTEVTAHTLEKALEKTATGLGPDYLFDLNLKKIYNRNNTYYAYEKHYNTRWDAKADALWNKINYILKDDMDLLLDISRFGELMKNAGICATDYLSMEEVD